MLTPCRVGGAPGEVGLLAPLGVRPEWQRRGIGRALVGAAIAAARDAGMRRVLVLGDPAYYGRFGFAPEAAILPPYALPPGFAGAWQSLAPSAGVAAPTGPLLPPAAWLSPGLWGPQRVEPCGARGWPRPIGGLTLGRIAGPVRG
jgi:putative acetyltransferase